MRWLIRRFGNNVNMASVTGKSTIDSLFPPPSRPSSALAPIHLPGVSHESTSALQRTLKDNHTRWHAFFNDKGFHNHASHHLLAIYSLGASGPVIDAAYQTHVVYQRPAVKSPGEINESNFNDHLGEEVYYSAYVSFFTDVLLKQGASATIEEFLFSSKANFDPAGEKNGKPQPEMLNRLMAGLVHPMIHVGYGAEFGLLGMLAEGLAQTTVHSIAPSNIFSRLLLGSGAGESTSTVSGLTGLIPSLTLSSGNKPGPKDTHAFTILARILKDPKFVFKKPQDLDDLYNELIKNHGDILLEYAEQWILDISDPKDVERKIEELTWTNVLIYVVGGWKQAGGFTADFVLMHLVTSSIFLPSLIAHIKPASQIALLKAYFVTSLGWWIARGRPKLDIAGFFSATSSHPYPHGPAPSKSPHDSTLPSATSPYALTPNPWLPLIQTTIVHPNEHICKLQRTLCHCASLFGSRPPGQADFKNSELEGAEKLDGTLFIRGASLTAEKLGWLREGEEPGTWSFEGFFNA